MTHTEFIALVCDRVEEGSRFTVNFEKRTLRVDGKLVDFSEVDILPEPKMQTILDAMYYTYKHSVPSERSESHRKCYFKALPEDSLSDDDMLYGERREPTRCRLELYILLMIVSGQLRWHSEWGSWFWQSPNDKDFIILRQWIEPLVIEKQ
mgnify:FL=1